MDAMSKEEPNKTDALLDTLLHKLPDKPVASNFTSRVLHAIEPGPAAGRAWPAWLELLRHPLQLVPRLGGAAVALCLGLFSYQHFETAAQARLAASVATVAQVSSLPNPDLLRDFDAVCSLNVTPAPDTELLALLQ